MVLANTFATDTRVRREARSLACQGFDVQVLCWDRQALRPPKETIDQCSVRNFRLGKTSILPTSRLYYLIAALLFQLIIMLRAVRAVATRRSVILHAHDFNALLGSAATKQFLRDRVRLVYDSHELTPGAYKEWYGSLVSRIVERVEFAALRRVDAIITANEAILEHLCRESSAPAAVIHSSFSIGEIPKLAPQGAKEKLGLSGLFVTIFTGKVRQDYHIGMILNAAHHMKRNGQSRFKFLFVGPPDSAKSLVDLVRKDALEDFFIFRGHVPDDDLPCYYMASDLCFAVTSSIGPNSDMLTPIKMFESMGCGVPVIVREGTLAAKIVRRWHCGVVVPSSEAAFVRQLVRLGEDPGLVRALGAAGRKAFLDEYNWDRMQARLLQLYKAPRF